MGDVRFGKFGEIEASLPNPGKPLPDVSDVPGAQHQSPSISLTLDQDGKLRSASQSYEELTGYPLSETDSVNFAVAAEDVKLETFSNSPFQYINFQGRYSLFAMDTPLRWIGTNGLGFVTVSVLILWGIGIIGFLYGIQPQARETKLKVRDATGFGFVFLAVGLLLAPNLPQSLYWWN